MATTKKAAAEAANTETKVAAVKAEEAAAEKVTAETKAEAVTAAPAKNTKTAAKKTTKKSTKTTKASKKEEAVAEVKAEAKAEAAPVATTEFFIEYKGGQISTDDIVRLVKGNYGKDITDLKVYFKLDDDRAYYVADGVAGSVKVLF